MLKLKKVKRASERTPAAQQCVLKCVHQKIKRRLGIYVAALCRILALSELVSLSLSRATPVRLVLLLPVLLFFNHSS